MRTGAACVAIVLVWGGVAWTQTRQTPTGFKPSAAYVLIDFALDVAAREIARVGARPTINSRELFIVSAALFDAWALYDESAGDSHAGPSPVKAPRRDRNDANRERAMAAAVKVTLLELYPSQRDWLEAQPLMKAVRATRAADMLGIAAAQRVLAERRRDGANQLGDERGAADATPYGDYTFYVPANGETVTDPDRWQPIPFVTESGEVVRPGFLTPHWYRVRPYALTRGDQFRPPPPPRLGSAQLADEVAQVVRLNGTLSPEQKATIEFMRDGPRSTGQAGHWLRFAQAVSRRDGGGLERDVKLFFAVAAACFDAFIAAWDAKRAYDSARPWTLVRALYAGRTVRGWLGPGLGSGEVPAERWAPYSPATFVTPPFPGYVSGHSTVSAAAAKTLELFTGSDRFDEEEARRAGALTEPGASHAAMQRSNGAQADAGDASCDVVLALKTFSATAELAGWSRVLGGYHIQADNLEGLELGRRVAGVTWAKTLGLFSARGAGRPCAVDTRASLAAAQVKSQVMPPNLASGPPCPPPQERVRRRVSPRAKPCPAGLERRCGRTRRASCERRRR